MCPTEQVVFFVHISYLWFLAQAQNRSACLRPDPAIWMGFPPAKAVFDTKLVIDMLNGASTADADDGRDERDYISCITWMVYPGCEKGLAWQDQSRTGGEKALRFTINRMEIHETD
jgi:hypothetical protein